MAKMTRKSTPPVSEARPLGTPAAPKPSKAPRSRLKRSAAPVQWTAPVVETAPVPVVEHDASATEQQLLNQVTGAPDDSALLPQPAVVSSTPSSVNTISQEHPIMLTLDTSPRKNKGLVYKLSDGRRGSIYFTQGILSGKPATLPDNVAEWPFSPAGAKQGAPVSKLTEAEKTERRNAAKAARAALSPEEKILARKAQRAKLDERDAKRLAKLQAKSAASAPAADGVQPVV